MKNKSLTFFTRVLLAICGLGLLVVLYTPIWQIDLEAPQYPEGLRMLIYANNLAGNVDIINGLNHYIGMKSLHANDFIEFTVLPGIIVFFAVCFLMVALINKRKWMIVLCILFILFGISAMIDFWRWEYDYGHDLNPDAAIIVPGMAYQPPLIGFKQLLNFGAYSMPAIGGWIFITVGIILLGLVVFEIKKNSRQKSFVKNNSLLLAMGTILMVSACSADPQPFRMGKDVCEFCKMTISDNRFGAELITKKNKIFKFDDEHCVIEFIRVQKNGDSQIKAVYFTNFSSPHNLINVKYARFLYSPSLKSPMNGNIAAFDNEDSITKVLPQFLGKIISWEEMQK